MSVNGLYILYFQYRMLTLRCCLQILALVLLGVVCACGLPSVPEYSDERFQSLNYRDDSEALPTDPRKPVREDGEWLDHFSELSPYVYQ